MRQVIKHRDIRLLNMIRRTDPVIPDPMKNKFADEQQFWTMVDDFRKLIAR